MKCLAVSLLIFLGGCSTSSFYPAIGATTGAAGGAVVGGVPGAAVGAGIGWGAGKGAQVVKENKNLKEEVEAYSKGDVEKLVQMHKLENQLHEHAHYQKVSNNHDGIFRL